jgi:CDGSH-type Zn-finger protein
MLAADGPLYVRGRVKVAAAAAETRVALCRCGQSKNKPYCDYSHVEAGFRHDGRLAPAGEPSVGEPVEGVDLAVSPGRNGPLHCTGSMTIVGTDGERTVLAETWLCRCGGSSRKPFCDGTHRKNGFAG